MKLLETLTFIRKFKKQNSWAERIISELEFAYKLLELENEYEQLVKEAVHSLCKKLENGGYITEEIAKETERILEPMSTLAKSFTIIHVGHAHIDMNWMWGYHETVATTLDTFRTVLDLMEEYPEFTFAQSQASVYKIVEEHHPEMLESIKKRVKEGRWEVTASTWVEADKNMPNTESLVRHILYTKQYLSELFGLDKDDLMIDFEPDTFGHSKFTPTILHAGGVKYYYHCRGYDKEIAYRWRSPSGEVLVYREPFWYNGSPTPDMALYAVEFFKKYGSKYALKVYGVGDHGGGPTRRDIEKILRMKEYPIYPNVKFGTYREFFERLEEVQNKLPVVEGELNIIFDGCFTTQSRIKMANRLSEAAAEETEKFLVFSNLWSGYEYPGDKIKEAWINILFNHFHDIIPGSGVTETREYAMGLFQKTMATLLSQKKNALVEVASNINTQDLVGSENGICDTSEGAGVAFGSEDYKVSQDSRGKGIKRIYHIFNPSPERRKEVAKIVLWDWKGDLDRLVVRNVNGERVPHQFVEKRFKHYWGHTYIELLVEVDVPAFGYSTYIVDEEPFKVLKLELPRDPRVQRPREYVLENEKLKAVFDLSTAKLVSLFDKENEIEYIDSRRGGAHFRLILEDINRQTNEMLAQANAWVVGRYLDVIDIHRNVKIKRGTCGELRNSIVFEFGFGKSSRMKVEVSLDKNDKMLKFKSTVDFREFSDLEKDITPQLSFYVPLNFKCEKYAFDVPMGIIERQEYDVDVPGLSFCCARSSERTLGIFSKTKYGYRVKDNSISLTLIRAPHSPDMYSEIGEHKIEFAILADSKFLNNFSLVGLSYNYNHELTVLSNSVHPGKLPPVLGFADVNSSSSVISCIKFAENRKNQLVIRLYEIEGKTDEVVIVFKALKPLNAWFVDLNENSISTEDTIEIKGNQIKFRMNPYELKTLMVEFSE
ncbi:alpha-mannosidase [Thermotoga sp.]|uniref:alpha-mannosidase n=1 Tax=Thermotoga sp. TaxID=28240 RepID=UPI0025F7805F|nr:alpha-mannosidase [Thermotoga sp.]MCD6551426.1 alpha-mannosidase [Thermotoga sp.]